MITDYRKARVISSKYANRSFYQIERHVRRGAEVALCDSLIETSRYIDCPNFDETVLNKALDCKTIFIPSHIYCGDGPAKPSPYSWLRSLPDFKESSIRNMLSRSLFGQWKGVDIFVMKPKVKVDAIYACYQTIDEINVLGKDFLEKSWSTSVERLGCSNSQTKYAKNLTGQRCMFEGTKGVVIKDVAKWSDGHLVVLAEMHGKIEEYILVDSEQLKLFYL